MRKGLFFCVLLCSCGSYSDFSLPPAAGPRAVSFTWRADPEPQISPGDWDSVDALNPSVVVRDGAYFNFYSGYDGRTWHTGLATSPDGVRWRKEGRVLSPRPDTWEGSYIAANGAAIFDGGGFRYWYVAGPRDRPAIGLAQSTDGMSWRRHPAPVIEPGPRGSWDERGAADPYVLRAGEFLYLYYLGQDRARRQRLGVARSADGVRWVKLRANPLLEPGAFGAFDEKGLGEPAVWMSHGQYWMLYTGRDRGERRRMGLARSADGVRWEKLPDVFAGSEAWNREVICDAAVLAQDGAIRVWFGGGDAASPDENLHGRIGHARLVPRL